MTDLLANVLLPVAHAEDAEDGGRAFAPHHEGGRIARFLSGDVAQKLIEDGDRTVGVLPNPGGDVAGEE